MASPTILTTPRTLILTSKEATLRELLVDIAQEIDHDKPDKDRMVLRFVGGWVRDRLLGLQSVDIDVGINNMTGYEFTTRLDRYNNVNIDKYGLKPGRVSKIKSNPERSKHLETAIWETEGWKIDFVNLRKQGAFRRDCTINALFYNLHTELVEDFTGLGIQDLAGRLIRTPLPPKETFTDDPLRTLRLIRFSSRLGFTIVPEAEAAMKLLDIKACNLSSPET
ncbi:tRNA nucleotidyltransferase [Tuber indicum]|nr:tRNA nucleotidyltransferase [Tuber indicum]